jgi:TRAP-type C4-dicarboxylate transport system substrate-binding protein
MKLKRKRSMKVLSLLLVLVLLLGAFSACGGNGGSSDNGDGTGDGTTTRELSLSLMWGPNHELNTKIIPLWNEYLAEATNGEVQIVNYPGGTLTSSTEAYEGVVQGISDMAIVGYGLTRGRFPVVETFILPGIDWYSSMSVGKAFDEGMRIIQPKEHEDAHFLFGFSPGPGEIISQVPVRNLDDLQGLDILVNSGTRADAMELLGANPIMMPTPEFYEALQRGVAKAALVSGETLEGYRLFEVTGDYITAAPFLFSFAFGAIINHDVWESLSPAAQEALSTPPDGVYELFNNLNVVGYQLNASNKEVEIIYLPEEEQEIWKEKIQPVIDAHLADLESRGIDSETVFETVLELSEKWNNEFSEPLPYLMDY